MEGKKAVRWLMAGTLALSMGVVMTGCPKKPPVTDPTTDPKPVELTVYSVKPSVGATDKALDITIMGSGFKDGAKAFVGETQVTDLQRSGDDTLRGVVPAGQKAGFYNVIVRNPDGKEATLQRAVKFEEAAPPKPDDTPMECSLKPVYFDFDMSSLNDESQSILQANFSCLKGKKASSISVEGHTDERGSTDYNLALGQRRADEVKRYLERLGASNVNSVSYGEERPAVNGSDEDAWSKNRRSEVIIVK